MNSLQLKSAICGLSLVLSASAFAMGGGHMGGSMATSHNNTRTSAPATRAAHSKANPTGHTGQPNQECGSATAPNTPGNAASAPGSAFNPDGHAGTVYAGEQPQNSRNPTSVAQYDAACFHQH